MSLTNCKICKSKTIFKFEKMVLKKYLVRYYCCPKCDFIQAELPYPLEEAYADAIVEKDTGVLFRNILLAEKADLILKKNFNCRAKFLDFAGGYGVLTRLMRDKGYNFKSYDRFCKNLFSQQFLANDFIDSNEKYELITALEIFEHLENPLATIGLLAQKAKAILFTTELIPENQDLKNWHYLSTDTGQHIVFYSSKTFEYLAQQLGFYYYTDQVSLHLFSKAKIKNLIFLKNNNKLIKAIQFLKLGINFVRFLPKAQFAINADSKLSE